MKGIHYLIVLAIWIAAIPRADAEEPPKFDAGQRERLQAGEAVILDRRPDESGEGDGRFVTIATSVPTPRDEVWAVISDKENAEDFLKSMLESRVVKRKGNRILVEQRTELGGPKDSYQYRLWYEFEPKRRIDFSHAGGELSDLEGAYWLFEGEESGSCLVVYSLYIDPGLLAPQGMVKRGMKESMPETLASIRQEVLRRSEEGGE